MNDYKKAIESLNKCLLVESKSHEIDAILGLSLAYYYDNDKMNAVKYLHQARLVNPSLNQGIAGLRDLEKSGFFCSEKGKVTLRKMFDEFR